LVEAFALTLRYYEQVKIFAWDIKALGNVFIGEVTLVNVYGLAYARFLPDNIFDAAMFAHVQ
jgi:hypothetical protein